MTGSDHKVRVTRLVRGERHVTDLDRLFADLRFAKPGRPTVTEVGDFAAHRDERDKGVVMRRAGDMQTSARIWVRQHLGIVPTLADMRAAGLANLEIGAEEQIRNRLGVSRQIARSRFLQGMNGLDRQGRLSGKQRAAVNYLGFTFMWLNAFDDRSLIVDLADVLVETGALVPDDRDGLMACRPFVALHAMTLMQGSRLKMPDGQLAPLRVALRGDTGTLRVVAEIPVIRDPKPIACAVSVFETDLEASSHCESELLDDTGSFAHPLELSLNGKLRAIV